MTPEDPLRTSIREHFPAHRLVWTWASELRGDVSVGVGEVFEGTAHVPAELGTFVLVAQIERTAGSNADVLPWRVLLWINGVQQQRATLFSALITTRAAARETVESIAPYLGIPWESL
jgi:hypothetical protein